MRMWMIDPEMLCDKHLLGEHGELHKHKHNFEKRHSIDGRITPVVQIEPASMELRHDVLAWEMSMRGINHKSPYKQPDLTYLPTEKIKVKVNREESIRELQARCPECAKRIKGIQNEQIKDQSGYSMRDMW